MLAANMPWSGWGFVAFMFSNVFWALFAVLRGYNGLLLMQIGFFATSLAGIYRWFSLVPLDILGRLVYTVFLVRGEVEMGKKVLYIHGYGSGFFSGDNPKVKFLREAIPELRIDSICTNGHYDPESYMQAIARMAADVGEYDVVMGSSLGGYWAVRYAMLTRSTFVVFNPVIDPSEQLKTVDGELADKYKDCPPIGLFGGVGGLVLLSKNDPVLDASLAKSVFADKVGMIEYDSNDHRLGDSAVFGEDLKEFFLKTVESFHL